MKHYSRYLSFALLLLSACHTPGRKPGNIARPQLKDTGIQTATAAPDSSKDPEDPVVPCYLVVADTGTHYELLDARMLALQQQSNLPVDTMGRYFNRRKNRIVLPDNDEDELYAGEYFPRRETGASLSLEYLNFYTGNSSDTMIVLLAGLYLEDTAARSALQRLKPYAPAAHIRSGTLYMGCMH